jgi:biopolymer transport protein TolR
MAFSSQQGQSGAMSDINVTPMVDVMLVLLIIFMVTAPLLEQGVKVDLPKTKAAPIESKEQKLVLTMTAEGKFFIGKTEVPREDLAVVLSTNAKLKQDRELYLHADQKLPYGEVVAVMSLVKEAGVESLGMVTDPLDGSGK